MIKSLNIFKAPSVDNLPTSLLNDGSEELAIPICKQTKFSFQKGIFPTAEKCVKLFQSTSLKIIIDPYQF